MADTANSAAWQDPGVRPAFSAGVGRALVPGRGASGTRPRRLRESNSLTMRIRHVRRPIPSRVLLRASLTSSPRPRPRADAPRFDFAGTVATESQRQSRGVLEHWRDFNERGVNVTAPVVSAEALKAFNQNSSVGKALKFPPQILGDVFADPNAAKDRTAERKRAEAKRQAAAFKGELIKGWAKAADEEKAVKAAFGALKGDEPFVADGDPKNGASAITDFFKPKPQPDGTITHFYKPQTTTDDAKRYVVVDETVEAIAPATPPFAPPARVMPDVRYADCDNSVPANGAARNEAPTSMFGPGP